MSINYMRIAIYSTLILLAVSDRLANPDFEFDANPNTYKYMVPSKWAGSGTVLISAHDTAWGGGTPPSGNNYVGIQSNFGISSYLQQNIGFDSNGFTLSFFARARPRGCNDDGLLIGTCLCNVVLQVSYCGTTYFSQSLSKAWYKFSIPVLPTCLSGSGTLRFEELTNTADCTAHLDAVTMSPNTPCDGALCGEAPCNGALCGEAPCNGASCGETPCNGAHSNTVLLIFVCLACFFILFLCCIGILYLYKKKYNAEGKISPQSIEIKINDVRAVPTVASYAIQVQEPVIATSSHV